MSVSVRSVWRWLSPLPQLLIFSQMRAFDFTSLISGLRTNQSNFASSNASLVPIRRSAKTQSSCSTLLCSSISFPVWQMLSIRDRSSVIMFSLTSTKEFSALTKFCLISSSVRCFVLHGLEIIAALSFCKKESFDLLSLVILKRFALHRKSNKLYWF